MAQAGGSPAAPGQGEYVRHPDFPNLPASAPDVYVRTVHACLCHHPEDRPQFSQVETVLSALGDSGKLTVRLPLGVGAARAPVDAVVAASPANRGVVPGCGGDRRMWGSVVPCVMRGGVLACLVVCQGRQAWRPC